MKTSLPLSARHPSRRGSVLLVSLLFSAIIAISIGSFLRLATTSTKLSYRTYYAGVAMNVAECGLEQALWSINRARTDTASAWTNGWTYDEATKSAKRTIDFGTIAGGATAVVKIYAREKRGGVPPMVISRAIITAGDEPPIEKWVQVDLRQRSRHDTGGVGRKGITFSGNNTGVASWNSDPDNDPATPYIPWSATVNNDAGSIASVEITSTIDVNNADVSGTAAIGSSNINDIKVGAQGYVGPFGTKPGTKDPDSVSTDFTTDLEVEPAPSVTYTMLGAVTDNLTLPQNVGSDHKITDSEGVTTYYYNASEVSLTNKTLTITEGYNVVLYVPNSGTAVDVGGGSGAITIKTVIDPVTKAVTAGTLKLYTPGNVSISGQGAANEATTTTTVLQEITKKIGGVLTITGYEEVTTTSTQIGQPISFQVYGTRPTAATGTPQSLQSISISGNGRLSAVVYAPNADISVKGGGTNGGVFGSLVGNSIKFTGNEVFYYDESLGNVAVNTPYGIDEWDELVSYADRNAFGSVMNF